MNDNEEGARRFQYHAAPYFLLILFVFLVLALIYGRIVIQNDGISYYAMSLSLVHDGDFNLRNQAREFPELRYSPEATATRPGSLYSCGFALLYAPFIYAAEAIGRVSTDFAGWRPYSQNARFPFPDALGIFTGSFLYGLLSVFLAWSLLVQRYRASAWNAFWIAIGVFVGTSLMFYTFTVPSFVQASDAFLVSVIFYLALSPNSLEFLNVRFRNVLLGSFLALSVMLRNNNVVLIPSTLVVFLWPLRRAGLQSILIACVEIFAGALPLVIVQTQFNLSQYGSGIATGYPLPVPQEWRDYLYQLFHFYRMLVDPSIGLFVWSPIAGLGFVGLLGGALHRRREALLALLTVTIVLLSISFYGWIWAGASFGQRFLTHLYICWVIGVFEAFLKWKNAARILAVIFVLWTFLLLNTYFIDSTSAEGRRKLIQKGAERYTPMDMLRFAGGEYQAARKEGRTNNPVHFLFQSLGARPYPTLQYILRHPNQG